MKKTWLILLAAVVMMGCTAISGREFNEEALQYIKVGQKMDYVQSVLGDPFMIDDNSNGKPVWMYTCILSSYLSKTAELSMFFIVFDKSGAVESFRHIQTTGPSNMSEENWLWLLQTARSVEER
jgi:outer membrane protein assembly factor BamE (lipoprotein component of BamABCDE complex)